MVLWVGGWLVGGGCDVIFNITEGGGLELFFCFGGGVLSTLVFQPPPPPSDNYCTVPNKRE